MQNNKDYENLENKKCTDENKPLVGKKSDKDTNSGVKGEVDINNIKTEVDEADQVSNTTAEGSRSRVDLDIKENPSEN